MKKRLGLFFKVVGFLTTVGMVIGAVGLLCAGTWLRVDDTPEKADALILLGGDPSRPMYGADLYHQGYAPLLYISRPVRHPMDETLDAMNIPVRRQEETYRQVLLYKGVPESALRYFGDELISTVDEAEELHRIFGNTPATLMVVTSPFHTRRAKTVLESALPEARIIMVSTPYEQFPEKWWTDFRSARNVVLETAKTIFHIMGGAFRSERNASIPPALSPE